MNRRIIGRLRSSTPTSPTWLSFTKVRSPHAAGSRCGCRKRVHAFCGCPDHRWSFHSERILPPDYDHSPLSHFTELQSVSHQPLIAPHRHGSESLALHLDPTLTHLPVSPQVGSFLHGRHHSGMELFQIHFTDKYLKPTVNVAKCVWIYM